LGETTCHRSIRASSSLISGEHRQAGQVWPGAGGAAKAVLDYLNGGRWTLVQEFVEIESRNDSDRQQLAAALAACKKHRAKLVIAKLDRLSRNQAFIAALMESGVEFVPHAWQHEEPAWSSAIDLDWGAALAGLFAHPSA
jgi:hypothetical protein